MKILRTPDSCPLYESERDEIRDAVDTLLFSHTASDCVVPVGCILDLAQRLVGSGRWNKRDADSLVDHVFACGPQKAIGSPPGRRSKSARKRRTPA